MSRQRGWTANWAGNHTYPFRLVQPTSLEELRSIVLSEPQLRVLGSRHSFNGICDGAVAVSLAGLSDDIEVDEIGMTVTCSGGATYGAVADALSEHGLALHNLASLPHISVAGAIATGTHGSGDGNGNLATAVVGLEILTASGDLVHLAQGDPDFEGAVVSLGALGVTTRVTLRVEPAYGVAQRVYPGVAWGDLIDNFDEVFQSGYSVSAFTDWCGPGVEVWLKSRDAGPPTELLSVAAADVELHPIPGVDPINCTAQRGVWGPWSDRLPHFRMGFMPSAGNEIQSEYFVPRVHAAASMKAIAEIGHDLKPLLQTSEIRTIRGDDLWLSPHFGRDSVAYHFTWVLDQPAVELAVAHLERALAPYSPRPHLGKVFIAGAVGDARYPRMDDFLALKARLDPAEKFTNDWLRANVFS